jgi:hypothetical protein
MTSASGRKVLFVIGAGASVDFGFPLGADLAVRIQGRLDTEFGEFNVLASKGALRSTLEAAGFSDEQRDAVRQLRAGMGMGESIDRFLFRRRTNRVVRDLGIMCVADIILESERDSVLGGFSPNDYEASLRTLRLTLNSWPAILLDHIIGNRGPEEINEGLFENVGFLIFNYDRCVEQTFYNHIFRRHALPPAVSLSIVRSIPMLHVYGFLGDPFDGSVPFGAETVDLISLAQKLQTYHEEIEDREIQARLQYMVGAAEKVCFLGFGFLEENYSRIFPDGDQGERQLFGTVIGSEALPLVQKLMLVSGNHFGSGNCTQFLRDSGAGILRAPWKI